MPQITGRRCSRDLVLLVASAIIGLPAALLAACPIKGQLFGLDPRDPLTFTCAVGVLLGAGAVAGFLPAWGAASKEPTMALRCE